MNDRIQSMLEVMINMGRDCRERCPIAVNGEVQKLVESLTRKGDCIIYTDGSERGERSGWDFFARCIGKVVQEEKEAFKMTTSSMRMEEEAVT